MWLDTFNQMRKESGMNLDELSAKSGVPKGTLSKISAGITKTPSLETMRSLVYAMGYTLKDLDDGLEASDTFSMAEKAHIKKYRLLDSYGKEAVDSVLEIEYRRYHEEQQQAAQTALQAQLQQHREEAAAELAPEIRFSVPEYQLPLSAGAGEEAGLEPPEDLQLLRQPPRGASYVARVHGNSMEPTYHDGDRVFVHATTEIIPGQIGVFLMDGQQWIKELGDHKLISHNIEYAPIPMRDDIRCQGLVLGPCDSSYFRRP